VPESWVISADGENVYYFTKHNAAKAIKRATVHAYWKRYVVRKLYKQIIPNYAEDRGRFTSGVDSDSDDDVPLIQETSKQRSHKRPTKYDCYTAFHDDDNDKENIG
jgi:hypothetical protein